MVFFICFFQRYWEDVGPSPAPKRWKLQRLFPRSVKAMVADCVASCVAHLDGNVSTSRTTNDQQNATHLKQKNTRITSESAHFTRFRFISASSFLSIHILSFEFISQDFEWNKKRRSYEGVYKTMVKVKGDLSPHQTIMAMTAMMIIVISSLFLDIIKCHKVFFRPKWGFHRIPIPKDLESTSVNIIFGLHNRHNPSIFRRNFQLCHGTWCAAPPACGRWPVDEVSGEISRLYDMCADIYYMRISLSLYIYRYRYIYMCTYICVRIW